MNVAVVQFPGTNCEYDTTYAFEKLGATTSLLWHKETTIPENTDLVVIPGGFSYGDYLRSGAIAGFSPVMEAIKTYADKGGYVLGICNGFQILTETKMLPGALKRNDGLHFISKHHHIKIENNNNAFLSNMNEGDVINIPIAHADGNYFIDPDGLKELEENDQILVTYCDQDGNTLNPNGSVNAIAGITNKTKNVFGLMPHPERAIETLLGSDDGLTMLKGFSA
jgi:phosphoribosylformylglycinamidine synthase